MSSFVTKREREREREAERELIKLDNGSIFYKNEVLNTKKLQISWYSN